MTTSKVTPVKKFEMRDYTMKELAHMYKRNPRQINRWLSPFAREIGERIGHSYTPAQIKKIVDLIGLPPGYELSE